MAYNITLTNGDPLVTIGDGLADTSQSSISLFGKNYTGYGIELNENQVHMLENFAFSSPPDNALVGQLWWDSGNNQLKVKNETGWKTVGATTASSAPAASIAGDLWWDTTNKQLKVYSGSAWLLSGPSYTQAQGVTGAITETVQGAYDSTDHTIVKFYIGGTVAAVLSKDATFDINSITGFTSLKPGFNLPSGSYQYIGNANNALNLGGIPAANYLRSDVLSESSFPLKVKNDSGITVGVDEDFTIKIQSTLATLEHNIEGGDIRFNVKVGGIPTQALQIDGADARVYIAQSPISSTGVANKEYVDTSIQVATDAVTSAQALLAPKLSPALTGTPTAPTAAANNDSTQIATTAFVNDRLDALSTQSLSVATLTVSAGIAAATDGDIDIGTNSHSFRTIYGKAITAQYADLAENYVANEQLDPGTVVDFGGAYEVCKNIADSSTRVAGVVSTSPAYLMNSSCTGEFVVSIALQGRCPVKVTGKIYPGALLVAAGNGHARAEENPKVGSVIGKAIGSFDGESGIIEVAIGRC